MSDPNCPKCNRKGMLQVETDSYHKPLIHCYACGYIIYKKEIEESIGIRNQIQHREFKPKIKTTALVRLILAKYHQATVEQISNYTGVEYRKIYLCLYGMLSRNQIQFDGDHYALADKKQKAA